MTAADLDHRLRCDRFDHPRGRVAHHVQIMAQLAGRVRSPAEQLAPVGEGQRVGQPAADLRYDVVLQRTDEF